MEQTRPRMDVEPVSRRSKGTEKDVEVSESCPPSYLNALELLPPAPTVSPTVNATNQAVQRLLEMGFSQDWAEIALRHTKGNVEEAIAFCIDSGALDTGPGRSSTAQERAQEVRATKTKRKKSIFGFMKSLSSGKSFRGPVEDNVANEPSTPIAHPHNNEHKEEDKIEIERFPSNELPSYDDLRALDREPDIPNEPIEDAPPSYDELITTTPTSFIGNNADTSMERSDDSTYQKSKSSDEVNDGELSSYHIPGTPRSSVRLQLDVENSLSSKTSDSAPVTSPPARPKLLSLKSNKKPKSNKDFLILSTLDDDKSNLHGENHLEGNCYELGHETTNQNAEGGCEKAMEDDIRNGARMEGEAGSSGKVNNISVKEKDKNAELHDANANESTTVEKEQEQEKRDHDSQTSENNNDALATEHQEQDEETSEKTNEATERVCEEAVETTASSDTGVCEDVVEDDMHIGVQIEGEDQDDETSEKTNEAAEGFCEEVVEDDMHIGVHVEGEEQDDETSEKTNEAIEGVCEEVVEDDIAVVEEVSNGKVNNISVEERDSNAELHDANESTTVEKEQEQEKRDHDSQISENNNDALATEHQEQDEETSEKTNEATERVCEEAVETTASSDTGVCEEVVVVEDEIHIGVHVEGEEQDDDTSEKTNEATEGACEEVVEDDIAVIEEVSSGKANNISVEERDNAELVDNNNLAYEDTGEQLKGKEDDDMLSVSKEEDGCNNEKTTLDGDDVCAVIEANSPSGNARLQGGAKSSVNHGGIIAVALVGSQDETTEMSEETSNEREYDLNISENLSTERCATSKEDRNWSSNEFNGLGAQGGDTSLEDNRLEANVEEKEIETELISSSLLMETPDECKDEVRVVIKDEISEKRDDSSDFEQNCSLKGAVVGNHEEARKISDTILSTEEESEDIRKEDNYTVEVSSDTDNVVSSCVDNITAEDDFLAQLTSPTDQISDKNPDAKSVSDDDLEAWSKEVELENSVLNDDRGGGDENCVISDVLDEKNSHEGCLLEGSTDPSASEEIALLQQWEREMNKINNRHESSSTCCREDNLSSRQSQLLAEELPDNANARRMTEDEFMLLLSAPQTIEEMSGEQHATRHDTVETSAGHREGGEEPLSRQSNVLERESSLVLPTTSTLASLSGVSPRQTSASSATGESSTSRGNVTLNIQGTHSEGTLGSTQGNISGNPSRLSNRVLPSATAVQRGLDEEDDATVHGEAYVQLLSGGNAVSQLAESDLYVRDNRGGVFVAVAAPLTLADNDSVTNSSEATRHDDDESVVSANGSILSNVRNRLYGSAEHRFGNSNTGVRKREFLRYDIDEQGGQYFPIVYLRQPKLAPNSGPQAGRPKVLKLNACTDRSKAVRHAEVNTPPMWAGRDDPKECILCKHTAGMFFKVHHCRNCGYYVCTKCSKKDWPASMLPRTYVPEKDKFVRVCDSCVYIQEGFIAALRGGDVSKTFSFFSTGNVNLHNSMSIYKSEEYPIHAAVEGGSLQLVRWLVEDRKCSLYVGREKKPLARADGLTCLSIASYFGHVDIMQYLVHKHGAKVSEISDSVILMRGMHALLSAPGDMPEPEERRGWFGARRSYPIDFEQDRTETESDRDNRSRHTVTATVATGDRHINDLVSTTAEVAVERESPQLRPKRAVATRRSLESDSTLRVREQIERRASEVAGGHVPAEILDGASPLVQEILRGRQEAPRSRRGRPSRRQSSHSEGLAASTTSTYVVPYQDDDIRSLTPAEMSRFRQFNNNNAGGGSVS